jgi:hypothetical protein
MIRRLAVVLVALALVVPFAVASAGPAADQIALLEAKVAQLDTRIAALESASPAAVYDITAYGATTGAADNTIDINKAIDAASAAGGGTVIVPRGTFTAVGIVGKSNVTIRGDGYGSVLKLKASSNTALIGMTAAAVSHFFVIDLQLDGNKANQAEDTWGLGIGSGAGGCNDCLVERVWVHDTLRTAIYLEGARNRVINNDVENVGNTPNPGRTGIVVSGENVPGGFDRVIGNRVRNATEYGIKVYPNSDHTIVGDNLIENAGRYGIYVQSSDYVSLPGNEVDGSGNAGILIQAEPGTTSNHANVTGGSVTGSAIGGVALWAAGGTIDGTGITGVDIGDNAGSGIQNNAAIHTTVTGNRVHNNGTVWAQGSAGVDLMAGSTGATITGNIVWSNGNATWGLGVWSFATNTDVTVTGNRVFNDGGQQRTGIASGGASDYWTVTGNNVRGNLTAGMDLVGANNVVASNIGYP